MEPSEHHLRLTAFAFALLAVNFLAGCDTFSDGSRYAAQDRGVDLVHHLTFPDDLDLPGPAAVQLAANRPTSITYRIGKPDGLATIEMPLADQLTKLLQSGDTWLQVEFRCFICSENGKRQPPQSVIWVADQQSSTNTMFRFTPTHSVPPDQVAISLLILRDGVHYDRIDVSVDVISDRPPNVKTEGQKLAEPGIFPDEPWVKEFVYDSVIGGGGQPDLRLYLDPDAGWEVYVYDQDLFGSDDAPFGTREIKYPSKVRNLEKTLEDTYVRLSCLTVPGAGSEGESFRAALLAKAGGACAKYPGNLRAEKWPQEAFSYVGKEMSQIGRLLYRDLIPDEEMHQAFERLYAVGTRRMQEGDPIKVLVTSEVSLPIQLMYPLEDWEPEKPRFFGLVFDVVISKEGRAGDSPAYDAGWILRGATSFAGFKGDSRPGAIDLGSRFAASHYRDFRDIVLGNGGADFAISDNKETLLKDVDSKRTNLTLVWGYLHGDGRGWSGPHYPGLSETPGLIFEFRRDNSTDALRPMELKTLVDRELSYSAYYLPKRPLVVLIACETGAASIAGTSGTGFSEAFFKLGARGVVVTEAEVDGGTASLLGIELIEELVGSGSLWHGNPSKALFSVRRRFLLEHQNLWPLLFKYEGLHGQILPATP